MKKILSFLLLLALSFTLFSCHKQNSLAIFEVGKSVPGVFGESFELYIAEKRKGFLTDDKALISVKLVMEKELDINNKADYDETCYNRYRYSVSVNGKVNADYAGRQIHVWVVFVPEYCVARNITYHDSEKTIVSDTGEFSFSYNFDTNIVYTGWIPNGVSFDY